MVQRLRRSRCGGNQANATAMIIKGIKIHRLDGSSRWPIPTLLLPEKPKAIAPVRVRIMRPTRAGCAKNVIKVHDAIASLEVRHPESDGKLRAHFPGHSHWPAGLSIDGTPERARLREELAIALTPDLGETFKREPSGFADPCTKHDFVAERGGRLVIDFVAQHDPTA